MFEFIYNINPNYENIISDKYLIILIFSKGTDDVIRFIVEKSKETQYYEKLQEIIFHSNILNNINYKKMDLICNLFNIEFKYDINIILLDKYFKNNGNDIINIILKLRILPCKINDIFDIIKYYLDKDKSLISIFENISKIDITHLFKDKYILFLKLLSKYSIYFDNMYNEKLIKYKECGYEYNFIKN